MRAKRAALRLDAPRRNAAQLAGRFAEALAKQVVLVLVLVLVLDPEDEHEYEYEHDRAR